MNLLDKAPTLITVAVLAIIFACLERQVRSARTRFWTFAWLLVFIHFLAQAFEPANGTVNPILSILDWGALQASAVVFVVAASSVVEDRVKRLWLLLLTGVPSVAFTVVGSYDVNLRWPYIACLTACFAGGIGFMFCVVRRFSIASAALAMVVAGTGLYTIHAALQGSFDPGATALLGLGFALPGVIMCRNQYRTTPGVLTVIVGFLFWGAVFPVSMLTGRFIPQVHIPAEMWNVPKMFVAFGMILAAVEEMQEALRREATHDGLTGAWNRSGIMGILERETLRAERQAQPLGVIMIDVDDFKSVNDTHGHRGGDAVLRSFVKQVASVLRPYDSLGRFGGEEFLIVAPGCGQAQTRELSERVRTTVADSCLAVNEKPIRITISAGFAVYTSGCPLESLLHLADTALYVAKRSGRNRVEAARDEHAPVVSQRIPVARFTDMHESARFGNAVADAQKLPKLVEQVEFAVRQR